MYAPLVVLHVMVCIVLIAVVLLQRGKGADIGAALGGGASNTVFGGRGAGNFLTKLTTASAATFMATSLFLAYLGSQTDASIVDDEFLEETAPPAESSGLEEVEDAASGSGLEEIPPAGQSTAPSSELEEIPPAAEEAPEVGEAMPPGEMPGGTEAPRAAEPAAPPNPKP